MRKFLELLSKEGDQTIAIDPIGGLMDERVVEIDVHRDKQYHRETKF